MNSLQLLISWTFVSFMAYGQEADIGLYEFGYSCICQSGQGLNTTLGLTVEIRSHNSPFFDFISPRAGNISGKWEKKIQIEVDPNEFQAVLELQILDKKESILGYTDVALEEEGFKLGKSYQFPVTVIKGLTTCPTKIPASSPPEIKACAKKNATLTLKKIRELKPRDVTFRFGFVCLCSSGELSDPYMTVSILNKYGNQEGGIVFTSDVVDDRISSLWTKRFTYRVDETLNQAFKVVVWDKDGALDKDDNLGYVIFNVNDLIRHIVSKPLQATSEIKKCPVTGARPPYDATGICQNKLAPEISVVDAYLLSD